MKLSKVASIFKKNKKLIIFTDKNGTQWISNNFAMYSMRDMPQLTPEMILRFFDVSKEKIEEWEYKTEEMPPMFEAELFSEHKEQIKFMQIFINWYGDDYTFFIDNNEVYSIKSEYLKPLLGKENEYLEFYKSELNGNAFLTVKENSELTAIICTSNLKIKDFANEIKKLSTMVL
ncbi:MAG: hypothetical protein FWF50_03060 [Defluviitaleaceae bacterium]|nr:hypothetical protein [Defluviitaleaceae bacterium]